jgi:hypothetical protein
MTEDELDAIYVEAIGSIDLDTVPNEAWGRLWADVNDPDLRDHADPDNH